MLSHSVQLLPALRFCQITLKAQKPPSPAYPKSLKTLGDHLRKRRLDLKLLQSGVAEQIGVDKTTVYNWERNRSSPSLPFLPKIVKFVGYRPAAESGSLGEQIVSSRRLLGLRQKDLAASLGVDPSTLARWERGEREPSKKFLERLTALLTGPPHHGHR